MSERLHDILGWPEVDLFPTDRRENLVARRKAGLYAAFVPLALSSFGMDKGTNTDLLRQSDNILRSIEASSEMPSNRVAALVQSETDGENKLVIN